MQNTTTVMTRSRRIPIAMETFSIVARRRGLQAEGKTALGLTIKIRIFLFSTLDVMGKNLTIRSLTLH